MCESIFSKLSNFYKDFITGKMAACPIRKIML